MIDLFVFTICLILSSMCIYLFIKDKSARELMFFCGSIFVILTIFIGLMKFGGMQI
jgi:hypothetical protein